MVWLPFFVQNNRPAVFLAVGVPLAPVLRGHGYSAFAGY